MVWVCDDSRPMANLLCGFIQKAFKEMNCSFWIETFYDGEELLNFYHEELQKPDIIFLAARMKKTSGFQIAENLEKSTCRALYIFVSLYQEMILPSLRYKPFGFILKAKMNREVKPILEKARIKLAFQAENSLIYKYKGCVIKIPYENIIYIRSDKKNLLIVQTYGRENILWSTIKEVYASLPKDVFVKASASCIANIRHIKSYADKMIVCSNGDKLQVSRGESKNVKEALHAEYT